VAQGEVTMQSATERTTQRFSVVLLSVALHGSVFALLLLLGTATKIKLIAPAAFKAQALVETAGGSHAVSILLPAMNFAAQTRKPTLEPEATRKTVLPIEHAHSKISGGGAPPSPHAGDGTGQATTGNGSDAEDAQTAFPIFSPHPPVTDRSLLPATEMKITIDVKLDELGKVVSETLVKGLGNKLDQIALDTVMTWRFHPATINGKPVSSEAELIFPFNPNYPITGS
jgi:TonB family protein